jgi:hypothetical protein
MDLLLGWNCPVYARRRRRDRARWPARRERHARPRRISCVTVLLVCLVAAAYMAGLSWFVGVVHYPLFTGVGAAGWRTYHRRHSDRTVAVVLAPMVAELVAAAAIAVDPPRDVGAAPAAAGLALAAGTWALTALASRLHRRIGDPLDRAAHRSLLAVHHARTALWTAHTLLVAIIVAGASRTA